MIRPSLPSPNATTLTTVAVVAALLAVCALLPPAAAQAGTDAAATPPDGGLRPQCRGVLGWVPLLMKKPYTSLLNNAYCPSWTTRHFMTKQEQHTYLTLPRGVPLAVMCGLCHRPARLATNITLQHIAGGVEQALAQVGVPDGDDFEHTARGYECRVQYALTGPLKTSGSITCASQLGIRSMQDTATYTVYDMPIVKTEETLDVHDSKVQLTCPSHSDPETPDNPLVHVWYYPLATSPRIAAPTTNPSVTFRLAAAQPLVVACATYHLLYASKVMVTVFTVKRSQSHQLQGEAILSRKDKNPNWDNEGSYGAYGEVREGESGQASESSGEEGAATPLAMPLVAILSATGTAIVVIGVIATARTCRRSRNQARPIR